MSRRLAVTIAILAAVLVLREPLAAASPNVASRGVDAARSVTPPPTVHDIQLKPGNFFRGQLPADAFPQSKEGVRICFYRENRLIAETRADRLGRFTLRYLTSGTGTLAVSAGGKTKVCFCRLWRPGTAPPVAKARVIKTGEDPIVRAQGVHAFPAMSFSQVATFAGVVGGAVATPTIWHNIQQDHKTPVSGSASGSLTVTTTTTTTTSE